MTSKSGTGNWIFLSNKGTDEYINMFAEGCHTPVVSDSNFVYESSTDPIVMRGILKYKIMRRCWNDGRKFYYMDTGYFGNQPYFKNPHGWKLYHRIVPDNLQHNNIITRPADRWEQLKIQLHRRQPVGKKIIVAAPDEKPCRVYNIDLDQWISQTVETLKKHTDREIEVRQRVKSRRERTKKSTLQQALAGAHALVTFNSNAATEAVMLGYPVFVLAPCHAALPVANQDLSSIENPYYPSADKLHQWVCHLAYGQFHIDELKSGLARTILEETQ